MIIDNTRIQPSACWAERSLDLSFKCRPGTWGLELLAKPRFRVPHQVAGASQCKLLLPTSTLAVIWNRLQSRIPTSHLLDGGASQTQRHPQASGYWILACGHAAGRIADGIFARPARD